MRTAKTAKPLLMCHKRQVSQQKLAKANTSSMKNEGRWTSVCREYTLLGSQPNSELVCALKDHERIGVQSGYRDDKSVRAFFHCGLGTIETESPKLLLGSHQQRLKSMRLSGSRFGAIRC